MRDWQGQSHVKWYCKYHVAFLPKYRRRSIYGSLRRQIGGILRELCRQHGVEIVEGHAMSDHIHLCLSIPPRFSVVNTVGFLKGNSAICIDRAEQRMIGIGLLGFLIVLIVHVESK